MRWLSTGIPDGAKLLGAKVIAAVQKKFLRRHAAGQIDKRRDQHRRILAYGVPN
jgi:hypothetical protein